MRSPTQAEHEALLADQARLKWLLAHLWEVNATHYRNKELKNVELVIRTTTEAAPFVQAETVEMIDALMNNQPFKIAVPK
jgi:ornithine cyclodeaminase/alanine dehydrogenase-like protein (mu-crystallin family)